MNNTPRLLNRLWLFAWGLFLSAAGVAFIAYRFVPEVQREWQAAAVRLAELNRGVLLGQWQLPAGWLWFLLLAVLFIAAVTAALLLRWQTGGKTPHFAEFESESVAAVRGTVKLDAKFAEALLQQHLEGHTQVVRASVTAHRVGGNTALKIRVEMRRGGQVSAVAAACQVAAERFNEVLGVQVPLVFEIKNGVLGGLSAAQRVL